MQYRERVSEEVCRLEIAYGTGSGFCERHPDRVAKLAEFKLQTRPPRFAYLRQLMSGMGFMSEDRLPRLSVPTLIVAGGQDRIIPVQNAELLHQLIPRSRLRIFENCGHHIHVEEPEEFNQAVIDFLKSAQ